MTNLPKLPRAPRPFTWKHAPGVVFDANLDYYFVEEPEYSLLVSPYTPTRDYWCMPLDVLVKEVPTAQIQESFFTAKYEALRPNLSMANALQLEEAGYQVFEDGQRYFYKLKNCVCSSTGFYGKTGTMSFFRDDMSFYGKNSDGYNYFDNCEIDWFAPINEQGHRPDYTGTIYECVETKEMK